MEINPVTLEGKRVRLEPMKIAHLDRLYAAGSDEQLWQLTTSLVGNKEDMRRYIETALTMMDDGMALPFVTIEKSIVQVVGSTRYLNIDKVNRRLEIGSTWISLPWQRTHVNTEAKYLMLRHAFETLGCIRVEFKTDSLNEQSRRALLGIGAVMEGVFRNHMIVPGGRIRHSVYYSIIDSEWPNVKKKLEDRMDRAPVPPDQRSPR